MSSETKWTPGPWSRGKDGDGQDGYVYCSNAQIIAVAICYGSALRYTAFPREEEIANAQIIASAPTLYEALYQVLTVANLRDHPAIAEMARTALASARGES